MAQPSAGRTGVSKPGFESSSGGPTVERTFTPDSAVNTKKQVSADAASRPTFTDFSIGFRNLKPPIIFKTRQWMRFDHCLYADGNPGKISPFQDLSPAYPDCA